MSVVAPVSCAAMAARIAAAPPPMTKTWQCTSCMVCGPWQRTCQTCIRVVYYVSIAKCYHTTVQHTEKIITRRKVDKIQGVQDVPAAGGKCAVVGYTMYVLSTLEVTRGALNHVPPWKGLQRKATKGSKGGGKNCHCAQRHVRD